MLAHLHQPAAVFSSAASCYPLIIKSYTLAENVQNIGKHQEAGKKSRLSPRQPPLPSRKISFHTFYEICGHNFTVRSIRLTVRSIIIYFCKHLKWLLQSHSLPTGQLGCLLHFVPTKLTSADIIRHSLRNSLDHFPRVYFWLWRKPSFPRKGE